MDLVYTDKEGVEQGVINAFSLDLAFGEDENDFLLTLSSDLVPEEGSLIYIDGTEYGGIVRSLRADSTEGDTVVVVGGETWHGILASRYVCPAKGADYYVASGEANAAIAAIIDHVGLSGVFEVSALDSGFTVSRQLDRFGDCYSEIRKTLASVGAKLRIVKDAGGKPVLAAVPVSDYTDYESRRCSYKYAYERPVNHLICLGEGELAGRTVIHLYADEFGNVSQTQSIFGLDERQAVYDYSNADYETLLESGMERLAEMQKTETLDIVEPNEGSFDVGDLVSAIDESTGIAAAAAVSKVIVRISADGARTVSYEVGDVLRTFRKA